MVEKMFLVSADFGMMSHYEKMDVEGEALVLLSAPREKLDDLVNMFPDRSTSFVTLPTHTTQPLAADIAVEDKLPATLTPFLSETKPQKDPNVLRFLSSFQSETQQDYVTMLTGENLKSRFRTRHSTSSNITGIAAYLDGEFKYRGLKTIEVPFRKSYGPNVVAQFNGTKYPSEIVVLGAHYDSRAQNRADNEVGAPGADDDGSGSSALLTLAAMIQKSGIQFERTVQLVAFCGEEQGLLGSADYARRLREAKAKVVMMIQGDMLAYRKPGEAFQLGFPKVYHTPKLTKALWEVVSLYISELVLGWTGACCSDHQSFLDNGFPATAFFERNGPIADPMYHNSLDVSQRIGYDFKQLNLLTQAFAACLAVGAGVAGFA